MFRYAWLLIVLSVAGCANSSGVVAPFEPLDHGCVIDPQSCR